MDLFSTNRLVAMVEDLRSRPVMMNLLSLFFPSIIEETSEEIHFDTQNRPRRIAPFVHPRLAGRMVESQGFKTSTFTPAYIKDKRTFDSNRPLKRVMGEALTGRLSPEQRQQILLAMDLADQMAMIRRRKEIMASEALRTGQVTVDGEGYESVTVDYGRDAALSIDLSGGAAEWDDAGISPVDDVEEWAYLVAEKSGAIPSDVVFDIESWKLFRADTKFRDAVDLRRARDGSSIDLGPRIEIGASLRGQMGTLRLWTYADWYINDAGSEVPILPANTVIMGSAGIEGQQLQGAIRDEESGFQATEFWPKSWIEKDPSVRLLLMQSAPLVVPFRPDASLSAKVT